MSGNHEILKETEGSRTGLWLLVVIASLLLIAGAATFITFGNSLLNESGKSNAVAYAENFNFGADIYVDISVAKVVLSADVSPGQENLYMELESKSNTSLKHQVRLFNSGNNTYRGTLPEIEYGEWLVSLYPESKKPAWRINDVAVFPNHIVTISARK